ncbi:hypothetical protein B6U98_01210 [Thermoplasmatales archaeon ex4572_165]|nr:MAG: hypothetical protein B6U98_01210 [Thermoplasmatales archaeon ex4572_165]
MDMKNKRFLFIMILLILSCFFSSVTANKPATCGYGTCDTWFSFDGINWHNTTYRNAELHRGESFFIKTMISTTKPDIHVSIRFFEVGVNSNDDASFEILDGYVTGIINQNFKQIYSFGIIDTPTRFEKIWKIKVCENASWWNATSPLNIFVDFNEQIGEGWGSEWIGDEISYTVATIYIKKSVFSPVDNSELVSENVKYLSLNHIIMISILIGLIFLSFLLKFKKH